VLSFGEKVEVGFQGGLLKVAACHFDGGDCDELKDIGRNSLHIVFPGSSFGGGSGGFFNTFLEVEVVDF